MQASKLNQKRLFEQIMSGLRLREESLKTFHNRCQILINVFLTLEEIQASLVFFCNTLSTLKIS